MVMNDGEYSHPKWLPVARYTFVAKHDQLSISALEKPFTVDADNIHFAGIKARSKLVEMKGKASFLFNLVLLKIEPNPDRAEYIEQLNLKLVVVQ